MQLDKLGSNVVKRDDGGAVNVQDLDTKQLLQGVLIELQMLNAMIKEATDSEVEPRDVNIRDTAL